MAYAQNTSVPVERSQGEIRNLLEKYGATGFAFAEQGTRAIVMFEMQERRIKMVLALPQAPEKQTSGKLYERYRQECRSRWRSLVLVIKAKLESVATGINTFEEAFLAHVVLANGQTAGEVMIPQIARVYKNNIMPPLLPGAM